MRTITIFIEFTLSANILHTSDLESASMLYIAFLEAHTKKDQIEQPCFRKVLTCLFNDHTSPFIKLGPYIVGGLTISTIVSLIGTLKPLII